MGADGGGDGPDGVPQTSSRLKIESVHNLAILSMDIMA
jgi:hypothetical protein